MGRVVLVLVLTLLGVGPATAQGQVQPLVADLSQHLVAITTAYSGTEVLLFGATDGPGDVVVVVRGPIATHVVRRKDHLGVLWANRESVVFEDVPTFYQVASNRPLEEFARPEVLARHQIGEDYLILPVQEEERYRPEILARFRTAFLRLKREEGLYSGSVQGRIQTLSNRLFRLNLTFPANAPVGPYIVEVYLFREGHVISAEITPLVISKIGVGADLSEVATNRPVLYGFLAVFVASLAGWMADVVLRKR
ncbi:TIGR02186 family protein [Pararhodospirillum oryzae]|uniref:TIGR02186 family protein n=1 Tax=Pararhodospirillum oryzae TaxID=478448 RepID=A0A512H3F6_9PROT|nr:TIGR02186 family protein [Pararhodospirillum oryzae]GEO79971.1 hypothetical protein ROR02_01020 [Pararhodospirillum oryzae]